MVRVTSYRAVAARPASAPAQPDHGDLAVGLRPVARVLGRLARDPLPGCDEVVAGDGLSRRLRDTVGPDGADGILDFVGSDQTLNAAIRNAATMGAVAIVGQGFGTAQIRWGQLRHDCDVFIPQGAPVAELHEVVARAPQHELRHDVEQFSFDEAPAAYERLRAGTLNGRAVVLP